MKPLIYLLGLLLSGIGQALADSPVTAWLDPHDVNGRITMKPWAIAAADGHFRYRVSSRIEGRHVGSGSSQSGSLSLRAGQLRQLGHIDLGRVVPGDRFVVSLQIFQRDRLVAFDRIAIPDDLHSSRP